MIDWSEENKDSIVWHLMHFYECVQYQTTEKPEARIQDIARSYVDNEINMANGMKEYFEYERSVYKYNDRLLRAVKSAKGTTFYKYLCQIMSESDRVHGHMSIIKEPLGKFVKEKYGRQIPGYWVEQWSTGMEGDSFSGHVCVQLKPNKYLKFDYSM